MLENTKNEVENLFEEMIVSKIKTDINDLKNKISEIENAKEDISEELKNLAKNSTIVNAEKSLRETLTESDEKIDFIKKTVGENETNIEIISSFLDEQFQFSDGQRILLGDYLKKMFLQTKKSLQKQNTVIQELKNRMMKILISLRGIQKNINQNTNAINNKLDEKNKEIEEIKEKEVGILDNLQEIQEKTFGEMKVLKNKLDEKNGVIEEIRRKETNILGDFQKIQKKLSEEVKLINNKLDEKNGVIEEIREKETKLFEELKNIQNNSQENMKNISDKVDEKIEENGKTITSILKNEQDISNEIYTICNEDMQKFQKKLNILYISNGVMIIGIIYLIITSLL